MAYFSSAFLEFFQGLSRNNSKEWFDEHRSMYEKEVKKPFNTFVSDMIERISIEDPEIVLTPKEVVFRINRDIRFSKDKTPYKTYVGANITKGGRKALGYPGFYFQIGADGVMIAGGSYGPDKEQLAAIRGRIAADPDTFRALVEDHGFRKKFGEIQGEKNKIVPKEFKEAAADEPLIANKQFYYYTELGSNIITDKKLADRMMEYYHAGKPLNDFLKESFVPAA